MGRIKVEINPVCGERLRQLIKDNGTTQKQLAKDIGVSEQTIYNIVRGKFSLTEAVAKLILEKYPTYCTDLWLLGKAEYRTSEIEQSSIKEQIRNKVTKIFQSQAKRQERMLSVFAELVSECGYCCEYNGNGVTIKTPSSKMNTTKTVQAFYNPVSFSVSQEEIDLLYSCFKSATETFLINRKTNGEEK